MVGSHLNLQSLKEQVYAQIRRGDPVRRCDVGRAHPSMDYAMPRADALPFFTSEITEVPSTSNPLGLRGGSEGGTTPALATVMNAIVDALAELGIEHMEMPATPERVWRAIHDARAGTVSAAAHGGGERGKDF